MELVLEENLASLFRVVYIFFFIYIYNPDNANKFLR